MLPLKILPSPLPERCAARPDGTPSRCHGRRLLLAVCFSIAMRSTKRCVQQVRDIDFNAPGLH
jgi:hypothetical protein